MGRDEKVNNIPLWELYDFFFFPAFAWPSVT